MICPHCGSKNTHKRGFSHAGTPQFHCGSCNKRFSITTQPKEDTSTKDKIKNLITDKRYTINEISEIIRVNPSTVSECIARLRSERYNIIEQDGVYELSSIIQQGGKSSINLSHLCNKTYKIGAIGDLHLCSKYERLDALNTFYDICAQDGIKEIYIAGNWVDGEAVFNKYDLIRNGITPQIEYFCEMLPKRDGIMNYFIAGDDHEGWWQQREHIIIGEYAQMLAENKFNRDDMKYIGYMESDIELKGKNGSAIMRVSHPGGGSCFDDTAKILTKNKGWIYFRELSLDDDVATMRKNNHVFEWQKPTHITNEYYNGDMIHFKNRSFNFMVTPNHKLWVRRYRSVLSAKKQKIMPQKSHGLKSIKWHDLTASDIYNNYYRQKFQITTVSNKWFGDLIEHIDVPKLNPIYNNKRNIEQMQHVGSVDIKDMAKLIGWFVTEGYADKKRVSICQSKKANPDNHNEITELLNKLNLRFYVSGINMKDINISSKELSEYLRNECGDNSYNKKIPEWLKNQPEFILNILFNTLIKGDGWFYKTGFRYKSMSKKLLDDVSEIAQKLGYGVNINKDTLNIKTIQCNPTINIKPTIKKYDGRIYCCSVPNELIYVMVNGKAFWSHNSYAQSYTAQKIIESYTGGEKPQILLIGHYHKFEYTFARNVHAVQCGTFQDQTPFMRKKRLAAHVGGCILEITQAEDGSISRFKVEFIPFFDREFYNKWEYKN